MISDEKILAYLDGRLSEDETDELLRAVEDDPSLATRVAALDPLAAPIKAAFQDIPAAARMTPLVTATQETENIDKSRRTAMFGCIAASLGVGVFIGSWFQPSGQKTLSSDWREEVARYQALYSKTTVEHIDLTDEEITAQLQRASASIAHDLPIDTLKSVDGLTLLRAQILGFGDTPVVQIVYRTDEGAPVAFCIKPANKNDVKQDRISEVLFGLASVSWSGVRHGYMVIGTRNQGRIDKIAVALSKIS